MRSAEKKIEGERESCWIRQVTFRFENLKDSLAWNGR